MYGGPSSIDIRLLEEEPDHDHLKLTSCDSCDFWNSLARTKKYGLSFSFLRNILFHFKLWTSTKGKIMSKIITQFSKHKKNNICYS